VITPNFGGVPEGSLTQFAIKQPLAARRPSVRMRANSPGLRNRASRPNPSRGRAGFGVASFKLHRSQALPADAAPVSQRCAPALGRVPSQEPVLAFAPDLRWLILPFHVYLIR
jgi:hypothetical protein